MPDGTARESAADPASTAAGLASPASVVAARSGTCGADCIAGPCTLRDMRAAQRVLERHPGIALYAELAVLSHLTGWPMPIPQPPLLETLRALPMRLRDCALSHGVDAAVASRAPLICARVSPPALASHVVTALRARVSRGMWMCLPEEPRWLAPAYQWALLLDALTIGDHAPAGVGPDSRTGEWESVYGRPIGGPTRADQAATVHRWHDGGLRSHPAARPCVRLDRALSRGTCHWRPGWRRGLRPAARRPPGRVRGLLLAAPLPEAGRNGARGPVSGRARVRPR